METVLITGGTGLIGNQLSTFLVEKGYHVIILTRSASSQKDRKNISYAAWNPDAGEIDLKAIQATDFIIHLAGAPVMDKRWTNDYKNEIVESRTKSSLLLASTLKKHPNHVQAIISSSAIGWYGPDKNDKHVFTEDDPAAPDFLGQTTLKWEQSIETAEEQGVKVCKLRTGIVLADKGGALEEFIKPLKLGVATILGNGEQIISWIHIDDLCNMFHHAIIHKLSGSYNAVAPGPVSNKKLVLVLAKLMKNKFFIPIHVPTPVLKLMLGERSIEILKSATVGAQKISGTGFNFLYPEIEKALTQIIKKADN